MAMIAETPVSLPDYDPDQQIFCINFASNAAGKKKGTTKDLERGFKRVLDKALPELTPKGKWETAWGPAVYKLPKDENNSNNGPLNAWFVAQNVKDKLLVVAIAGTAQYSSKAWLEDCTVHKVVNYDNWTAKWTAASVPQPETATVKDGPLASSGTCFFVYNILNYPSPATGAAKGTLLGKFLQDFQKQNPGYTIIFTGHSLGGAVSPSLALGLVQSKVLDGAGVYTKPTAGASPGNAAFNKIFTKFFPKKGSYNTMAYNTLDIVPQAWSVIEKEDRKIKNISKIFSRASPLMRAEIFGLVLWAQQLSKAGTQYIGLPGEAFTSSVPVPPDIKTWKELREAGSYQHVIAYIKEIGIMAFHDFINKLLDDQPGVEPIEPGDPGEDDSEPDLADLAAAVGMTESQLMAEAEKIAR